MLRLMPLSGKDRYARTPQHGLDPFSGLLARASRVLQPRSIGHGAHQVAPIRSSRPRWIRNTCRTKRTRSFSSTACASRARSRRCRRLQPFVVRETRPGPEVQDDAGLLDYMRETIQTSWHMVGTCKMGVDADGGRRSASCACAACEALRVVDSSICPTIPSSNTNIPSIAIGEKGADLMLAAART